MWAEKQPLRSGLARDRAVDRKSARTSDDDGNGQGQREQVIFVSLTLLAPGPVHKERYMHVHHEHGDEHIEGSDERGDACQESQNKSQATEEFRADGEKCQWRGNVHLRGEKSHRSRKTVAAEPAQEFLRAMCEKDDA